MYIALSPSHFRHFFFGRLPIFYRRQKKALVWGGCREAITKSTIVGGSLNMFGFQTSWRIFSASVWWSPTIYHDEAHAIVLQIFFWAF